ncbi:hypothetical protein HNV11_23265 [Spirosoma taeanense]|uniref:LVIVD repeat-containing protein n=1 Tax=Spirosoma taeanense TaxID=2735870 RepID=A0A6M5YDJ6_9BACT|nr:hypothetical protein [Spirosoma taeanense]QJW92085.1 hypothetical protein HNV11_23265 [Spirosoma taeanense]
MKPYALLVFLLPLRGLMSCTDNCEQVRTFRRYTPYQIPLTELRQTVASGAPQPLVEPGKLYIKDQYLFIVEVKKGIHIFDNSDPANPRAISFLSIPGNVDIAVRDNFLYADSFIDLVALDISNPAAIKEVSRTETGFQNGVIGRTSWWYDKLNAKISDTKEEIATETVKTDCEGTFNFLPYVASSIAWFGRFYEDAAFYNASAAPSTGTGGTPTTGVGGSMARFAIANNQLYVVNNNSLQLFDIRTAATPVKGKTASLNWNVETIFPYRSNLFIGTSSGMYIYDITSPAEPKQVSAFSHVRSCDPVVVHENYAYVTLRGTSACGSGSQDVLDIIDISNPASPQRVKTYPLETPYGLGIDYPTLFICQGQKGLRVFDASNPLNLQSRQTFPDAHAFDVIPVSKRLLMVGNDGLYQYDYTDPNNLRLLSKIAVRRPY